MEGALHTVALTVSYDGTPFCGFARQPGQLTVQGSIETALRTLYRREVETVCAGRTDAGVHARGQVVSFDLSDDEFAFRTARSLKRSLNALVDDRIAISAVQEAPSGFSARSSGCTATSSSRATTGRSFWRIACGICPSASTWTRCAPVPPI